MAAWIEEMYQTMVLLALLSGLRIGEIFGLRWKCVDFQERSREIVIRFLF